MSTGFYVHVPFCWQACRYCDFHFAVSLQYKKDMIKAMLLEIKDKSTLFGNEEITTLYFGGGTPSVFDPEELQTIIHAIKRRFQSHPKLEISLEANPDDLSKEYLKEIYNIGIRRLSIGIQSFRDEDLLLMRRSHTAGQAEEAIRNARETGFNDINADLIYGIPGQKFSDWKKNVRILLKTGVQHISAYHLTFEPGTVFDHWRKKKRIFPVEEEESLMQFQFLKRETKKEGFEHYEISNFALPGFLSKHNTSYWKNQNYIGIGPSAHSYNGMERFWNISHNHKYMELVSKGEGKYVEKETLSTRNAYNEYMLTSLRTVWGIDLDEISSRFGDNYVKYTRKIAQKYSDENILSKSGNKYSVFEKGIFLADQITRDFIKI